MRILVTGGCGFIGSAVCRLLISKGVKVLNYDNLTYAADARTVASIASDPNYAFIHADICNRAAAEHALKSFEPDAVMHLAAETHVDRSIDNPEAFVSTNAVGTYQLLRAVTRYRDGLSSERRNEFRFLHVSTDEVFGSIAHGQFTESSPRDPSSPYSASKAAADHFVMSWHRTFGLPIVQTNCSNNYGPYQFPEKLVSLMIVKAIENEPLTIHGDGSYRRDWLYVEDHAEALTALLGAGAGDSYVIGGLSEQTNLEVIDAICEWVNRLVPGQDRRRLICFVADRPGQDKRYAVNPAKIMSLGWKPKHDFHAGIEKTIRWYLTNRDWWEPLRNRAYGGDIHSEKA